MLCHPSHVFNLRQGVRSLRSKFVPYFNVQHVVHGQLFGPYRKLPLSHRRLTLDLVTMTTSTYGPFNDDLHNAVACAVAATEEEGYWEQLQKSVQFI